MAFRVLLATRNKGKIAEFVRLFGAVPDLQLVSLDSLPPLGDVVEDGPTFEQNAQKKAVQLAHASGMAALADDSGLEVDALDGAPGVYSARFAGQCATDADNNRKLLSLMSDVSDVSRTARFRCVLALAEPAGLDAGGEFRGLHTAGAPRVLDGLPEKQVRVQDGASEGWVHVQDDAFEGWVHVQDGVRQCRVHLEEGACEGRILRQPRGMHGFGYDPVFVPEGDSRTMAELAPEEKNAISHRARAAWRMAEFLRSCLLQRRG